MNEWINIKDELPWEEEECLVAHIGPDAFHGYCFDLAIFHSGVFHSWELFKEIKDVTHWMPLPDPPKN